MSGRCVTDHSLHENVFSEARVSESSADLDRVLHERICVTCSAVLCCSGYGVGVWWRVNVCGGVWSVGCGGGGSGGMRVVSYPYRCQSRLAFVVFAWHAFVGLDWRLECLNKAA